MSEKETKQYRTQKKCLSCKKPILSGRYQLYCPECAIERKLDTVVRLRTCCECGARFYGGAKAVRCPSCADVHARGLAAKYKRDILSGKQKRRVGTIDTCPVCGDNYTVSSGRQKYCTPECSRLGILQWQREHKKGYHKAAGQDIKKKERHASVVKLCTYCNKPFQVHNASSLCSDYCRQKQKQLSMLRSDMKRGYNINYQKYIDEREAYRKQVEETLKTQSTLE